MTTFGDYRLVDSVHTTSHGAVHLAEPPARLGHHEPLVELKTLKARADGEDFRRIANELRLLHTIDSPYVIELLDAGSVDGQLFLVTRNYGCGTLGDRAAELGAAGAAKAVADAARGTHALHECGVAHRDIRPDNIVLSSGPAMIGNLDLAQLVTGASTVVGGPLGSLQYTAPEIVFGEPASRRSDVWSLAMTLHVAITGVNALGELPQTSLLDACRFVIQASPTIHESVPDALRTILTAGLGVEPSSRPSTALEFAHLLDELDLGV